MLAAEAVILRATEALSKMHPEPLPPATMSRDDAFDLLRGLAALSDRPLIAAIAQVLVEHPVAPLGNALNHKQIASKRWLVTELARVRAGAGPFEHVLIVGGWIGVLSALMLEQAPTVAERVTTLDLDPDCAPVALTLNRDAARAGRFHAVTADMMTAFPPAIVGDWPAVDLVINTSMEHLADGTGWLRTLPPGIAVALQSNDYAREPDHVSTCADLATFLARVPLAERWFAGELPQKNYTRFMQIGRV